MREPASEPAVIAPPLDAASAPAAPARLRVQFTCTYDDFVEAHKIHRRPARRERIGLGERLLFIWILLGAMALIITLAIAETIYHWTRVAPAPNAELTITSWAVAIAVNWLPWLLVTGLMWLALSGIIGGTGERRPARQMMLLMCVVALLNAVLTAVITGGPAAAESRTQSDSDVPLIVTLLPWIAFFGVLWFYIFRYLRGMLPRHWDAQPHLRREQTMEQTEHGLRFDDGWCVRDFRWPGFVKFREGDGLFLLYVSEVSFHMVPKRAFTTPGGVESFRQLLEQRIPTDGPIPARFPMGNPTSPKLS